MSGEWQSVFLQQKLKATVLLIEVLFIQTTVHFATGYMWHTIYDPQNAHVTNLEITAQNIIPCKNIPF